jgi:hypothetical protein
MSADAATTTGPARDGDAVTADRVAPRTWR